MNYSIFFVQKLPLPPVIPTIRTPVCLILRLWLTSLFSLPFQLGPWLRHSGPADIKSIPHYCSGPSVNGLLLAALISFSSCWPFCSKALQREDLPLWLPSRHKGQPVGANTLVRRPYEWQMLAFVFPLLKMQLAPPPFTFCPGSAVLPLSWPQQAVVLSGVEAWSSPSDLKNLMCSAFLE